MTGVLCRECTPPRRARQAQLPGELDAVFVHVDNPRTPS
jgi:hypothetical protein